MLDRAIGTDDLQPPPGGGPGPVTFDKAHPYVPNTPGKQSTYRVADLSNPILQEWVKPSMKKANDAVLAGKVPFRARERCWPVGVPGFDAYSLVEPFYFYQMKNEVVVINQGGPEIRHIYMNVPHSKNLKPTWYGESVGHYENGDTLVIDTIGQNDKTYTDNYRTPHTTQIHDRTLEARGRRQDGGCYGHCRGPGRLHHALDRHTALAPRRRGADPASPVQREQRRSLQPGPGAASQSRQARFLISEERVTPPLP